MTISHRTLTGAQLHENKGVASATDNTVATASSGATVWQKLTASHLTGTGNAFGAQLSHFQYTQTSGTAGGTPSATNTWTKYPLNTTATNEITSATLVSSVISLPAGTYFADGVAMLEQTNSAKLRLRNTTAGATLISGMNGANVTSQTGSQILRGRFTLGVTSNVEVQYWVSAALATNGLGFPVSSGETEMYGDIQIWKIV